MSTTSELKKNGNAEHWWRGGGGGATYLPTSCGSAEATQRGRRNSIWCIFALKYDICCIAKFTVIFTIPMCFGQIWTLHVTVCAISDVLVGVLFKLWLLIRAYCMIISAANCGYTCFRHIFSFFYPILTVTISLRLLFLLCVNICYDMLSERWPCQQTSDKGPAFALSTSVLPPRWLRNRLNEFTHLWFPCTMLMSVTGYLPFVTTPIQSVPNPSSCRVGLCSGNDIPMITELGDCIYTHNYIDKLHTVYSML